MRNIRLINLSDEDIDIGELLIVESVRKNDNLIYYIYNNSNINIISLHRKAPKIIKPRECIGPVTMYLVSGVLYYKPSRIVFDLVWNDNSLPF
jgi:hypothetical protein